MKPTLLGAARAIEAAVIGRAPRPTPKERAPEVARLGAAFVTLRRLDGSLRGCIGELEPIRPLVDSVGACAVSAALRDPRFPSVTARELDELRVAISVLTPSTAVSSPTEIAVGRHGIIVTRGARRGVFLPQVATEQGWDLEQLLAEACLKAGLPQNAWQQQGTEVQIFETLNLEE